MNESGFLAAFLAIPLIGYVISLVLALVSVAILTTIFAQLMPVVIVMVCLFLAYLTRNTTIYSGEKFKLTGGLLFLVVGLSIFFMGFLGIKLSAFSGSAIAFAGSAVGTQVSISETLSPVESLQALAIVLATIIILDFVQKKKLIRKIR